LRSSTARTSQLHRFSADFRQRMVYPLVALFFGTGNQTPKASLNTPARSSASTRGADRAMLLAQVSAAVVARVFLDESMSLFQYDPELLLNETPQNVAFEPLEMFYDKLRAVAEKAGSCTFRMRTLATSVRRGADGVSIDLRRAPDSWRGGADQAAAAAPSSASAAPAKEPPVATAEKKPPEDTETARYDMVIFACAANVARSLLAAPTLAERAVLSSVRYYRDLTVTHTDEAYMRRHHELDERAIYFIKT